jgi:predicted GNAT family acetyltransferase
MKIFGHTKDATRQVVNGRFELDRDAQIAFLEYAYDGHVLELIHTEVPESLRGSGLASELAHSALEWAREHGARVDVICPFVAQYLRGHPEYSNLLIR